MFLMIKCVMSVMVCVAMANSHLSFVQISHAFCTIVSNVGQ